MKKKPSLEDEELLLNAEHQALLDEHRWCQNNPHDIAGHERHRAKLHAHIDALRAFVARLKAERSGGK